MMSDIPSCSNLKYIFDSMRNLRWVNNFLPKNHYLNLTLSHLNLNLKMETHFELRKRKREINAEINCYFGQEEREGNKGSFGP